MNVALPRDGRDPALLRSSPHSGLGPETTNRDLFAVFGAAIFLLHPIQTEAVSYVTQRGEDMGALPLFRCFLLLPLSQAGPYLLAQSAHHRRSYGAAVITKEHTVTLPALLLLTDYFFNPGYTFDGIKRNWRLYSLIAAGFFMARAGLAVYLTRTRQRRFQSAGFNGIQYLFTEFRVFFAYIGLFLYPLWQTIDYDFSISKNLLRSGLTHRAAGPAWSWLSPPSIIAAAFLLLRSASSPSACCCFPPVRSSRSGTSSPTAACTCP